MIRKKIFMHPPLEKSALNLLFTGCRLSAACCLAAAIFLSPLFAEADDKLNELNNRVLEAKSFSERYILFEQLTDAYFKENKYNEYVEYLKSLSRKNTGLEPIADYYIALSRYYQLKYLEESQDWNEYFDKGNIYREQIIEFAKKAINKTLSQEPVNIYAKLVLWRLHKDQEDNLAESSLSDLMVSVLEYSKEPLNTLLIKDIADQLLSYREKVKSKQLYKLYVDKITAANANPDSLEQVASGFYKEGNIELSELVYDVYIEKIVKNLDKEKIIPILVSIAKQFSCQSPEVKDLFFAEKVFNSAEEIGGKDVFDEELSYLRAFNLEKAKLYQKAKDIYMDLISRYPKSAHADEANYKLGVIFAYIMRDVKSAKVYFEKLSDSLPVAEVISAGTTSVEKQNVSAEAISSLYHLGLLSQWSNDLIKARQYYDKLLEAAKGSFADKVGSAKQRLKEIDEAQPIESNLKMFLDLSLKDENSMFNMGKIDLKTSPCQVKINQPVSISAMVSTPESGCMQVKLEYLWSGDLGGAKPSLNEASFDTVYAESGVKEINLVVVSSIGILDRCIEIISVYPSS